jgi:RNA polymerase-associated protein CTR9
MSLAVPKAALTVRHSLFHLLAGFQREGASYDPEMAGYRAKYGGSLLRKVPEQLAKQELFEKEQSTKHEIAKKRRAEEKARLDEIQVSSFWYP